ncbi:predicted protein [Uncinocarpus reesii 1704]|uniref:Calponin-homology (CH) domain-containing protein n=1 Tax=Uncinocarpus reesii (strain UAMH 1704) TaxID=336963 RepID=C4JVQ7_UNCRE|nr:uncharacterized protein UREG_06649 [Uncinocarpus reesii 1704]EEP81784.1 predicted protein [Uncinocarpus reesii 1704]
MPTMFMSLFSPLKTDLIQENEMDSFEARIAKKRSQAKKPATTPQRAPLHQPAHIAQETAIKYDVAGSNTGKENVPPGILAGTDIKQKTETCPAALPDLKPVPVKDIRESPVSIGEEGTKPQHRAAAQGKSLVLRESCPNSPRTRVRNGAFNKAGLRLSTGVTQEPNAFKNVKKTTRGQAKLPGKSPLAQPTKRMAPLKLAAPRISDLDISKKYPILDEDIPNPFMYEENWLAHQEIVITQLVNSLFNSAHQVASAGNPQDLRLEFLDQYQDAYFSLLYKRVKASMLYGALRVPKDILNRGNRLRDDVGMRRKFLNLWLNNYDLTALTAAAETVIGRRMSKPDDSQVPSRPLHGKALRRSLEEYLDMFLIKNEDSSSATRNVKYNGEDGAEGSPYCQTLLRSIMIILLLDKTRIAPGSSLPRCLFIPSSEYKSSAAVLRALGHLLLPTIGDIMRPLSHLDCQVVYEQNRLHEHEYRIKNLAVDLRDGIILTRLVELLLLQKESQDLESTVSLEMPADQTLPLSQGMNEWPLSQHLKIPCPSRATKLFNVQIALGALSEVRGIGTIVKDIRPEDIVDGYREKTIALLWGLVGTWGLPGLLDWGDLKREITRLRSKNKGPTQCEHTDQSATGNQEDSVDEYEGGVFLLREWASCLARLKGVHLENMTTSFANGKIFESIVDEYEPFILLGNRKELNTAQSQTRKRSLAQRLKNLGCSSQFASLVAPSGSSAAHIFDQDFTVGALAFLCSRLLSASKRARAAVAIQSAWRRVLEKRRN